MWRGLYITKPVATNQEQSEAKKKKKEKRSSDVKVWGHSYPLALYEEHAWRGRGFPIGERSSDRIGMGKGEGNGKRAD